MGPWSTHQYILILLVFVMILEGFVRWFKFRTALSIQYLDNRTMDMSIIIKNRDIPATRTLSPYRETFKSNISRR